MAQSEGAKGPSAPPSQNHLEIQPQNLRVYITQQIQTPPQQNLEARLNGNLMILNPCP